MRLVELFSSHSSHIDGCNGFQTFPMTNPTKQVYYAAPMQTKRTIAFCNSHCPKSPSGPNR